MSVFLGTMAGEETYLTGITGQQTYARTYQSFGYSDSLRKEISEKGDQSLGNGYKNMGDQYSFTPFHLWDGRPFNTSLPTTFQGGGYFLTVETYDKKDPRYSINCFAYAIGTFGNDLEKLAEKDIKEIQDSVSDSIDHVVKKYFQSVTKPKDGDLAIYSISSQKTLYTPGDRPVSGITHAGIYRNTSPNWNSPAGGTVESKWGWLGNPHIFQHDIFFTPDFYGDQCMFYRLK